MIALQDELIEGGLVGSSSVGGSVSGSVGGSVIPSDTEYVH
jgi:hypothetical protein